jgi:DNA-binding MarR family transcriptional regulator
MLSTMNRESIDSVLRSLRRVNLQGSFFGQTVAIRFGLSESDIEALEVLIDTGAATAGRLSELMGLSTGAVTRVVDRLEQSGYVRRVPDPADRRRVIVEVVPEKVAAIQTTLSRIGQAGATEIGNYTEAQLALIEDFLTKMAAITREEATTLRDVPDSAGDSATTEHTAPIAGLTRARLAFRGGVSEVVLRAADDLPELYRAKFEGAVPQVRVREGTVSIQYRGRPFDWRKRRVDLTLNASLPWHIEVNGGASQFSGYLDALDLGGFEITGGVDKLGLSLGRPRGIVPIRITGGANRVQVERPAGVPIRLRMHGGMGKAELDEQKLGGSGQETVLHSEGARSAKDVFEIEVTGGLAGIRVSESASG